MTSRETDQLAARFNLGGYMEALKAYENLTFAMGALKDSAPLHHSPTFDLFSSHERAQLLQDAFNKFQEVKAALLAAIDLFARAYPQFPDPPRMNDKTKKHRQEWRAFFEAEGVPSLDE